MKKISRKFKYDFTIYTSLLLALVLIGYSGYSYLDNQSYSLKEILFPKEETIVVEEPKELVEVNKKDIINKYLLDIIDEIKQDQMVTKEMLNTWSSYEILDIKYEREVSKNYHLYLVNIKINNVNALVPKSKNNQLSTKEYIVISLKFNILKDELTNEYSVKTIDIPKNN